MSDTLSRRAFLQTTAALAAVTTVSPALALPPDKKPPAAAYPENGTLIPDTGWRIWLDREAKWHDDDIHLPEEISWQGDILCANKKPLPVNAPTGGWSALTPTTGKEVLLPTSVEQHFWEAGSGPDATGAPATPRPYLPTEYRYAADSKNGTITPVEPANDNVPINGTYYGVSWWHRPIDIPASMRGKRIFLHIRGAHLRAEVYLNGKLCGYSIMEELPFEADLTHAANPGGDNHLAIRITNPFGRYDWVDGLNAKWGAVQLYRSHGFGALDRGLTISAHDDKRITQFYVLNTPDPRKIRVSFEWDQRKPKVITHNFADNRISLRFTIIDQQSGKEVPSTADANGLGWTITCPDAHLWSLESPHLYYLRFDIGPGNSPDLIIDEHGKAGSPPFEVLDTRTIAFGFRTFSVDGLGTNALFRLNGKRIKLYSSISWGFWGLNGMFPVPELAEKEVTQAKRLNLNCLNFHRNLAKEDVLRAHDTLGLLRYMEPGAGKLAIGKLPTGVSANSASIVMEKPGTASEKFAQRYMIVKCVEMVKAFRSHPSVIVYCLQNEIGADLNNPDTLAVLAAMRAEDPSRCIVLNDGFVAPPRKAAQAWYEPWNDKIHRSDAEPWGGWWNQHQGAGDQWYDEFYKSPTEFTYISPERKVLSEFGEMEGCARPDNHALMLHQIENTLKKYGGTSYDTRDHREVLTAYDKFLDKWKFRDAFPTAEHLFNALGKTCYDTWQNYMENARISDDLDFAVISGWESTSIENHSGIVDNLRNFKSDPAPITQTLQPIHPVAKQRSTVITLGQPATFDLFLLNDTSKPATGTLTFSAVTPSGKKLDFKTFPAPAQTPDVFSYLLQENFQTPPLTEEGLYRFKFSISSSPLATQTKEIWVTACPECDVLCRARRGMIGVSGISTSLRKQLQHVVGSCYSVVDFKPDQQYRLIISGGLTSHANGTDTEAGETTGLEALPPTQAKAHKPEPGEEPITTQLGHLQKGILEAVQAGTPLLAIPQANTLSDGVAKQLAAAGAFTFNGNVGDFRAPWMGNWYFVREHALFSGLPQNQALGMFYQCKGRPSNGLLVDGPNVEVIVAYSRDHDRNIGAGTFTTKLGKGKVLYHRCPDFHPVLQQRFLANALRWLTS